MTIHSAKNILIIGPAWVGDMVMSQSLFKQLKLNNPSATIDVMAPAFSKALLSRMPEVRHIFELPFSHGELSLRKRWQLGVNMRQGQYDQVIVLPNSWKSGILPFATKIPVRTGWVGEYRYGLLNDIRYLDKARYPLMIQRVVALGLPKDVALPDILLKPALQVSQLSVETTVDKFDLNFPNNPVIALCPGAEYGPSKQWPFEHYAAVAKAKLKEGAEVWLLGSAKDKVIAAKIQEATQYACLDFTGRTTLGEAIDLLSLANFVVTNDSGLMHVAASLKRPLAVMYGSSSSTFTPPLSEHAKMLSLNLTCSPCFKRVCPLEHNKCLKDLSPEMVLKEMSSVSS